jgi:hypothetical protein
MSRSPLVVAASTIGVATLLVVAALLLLGPDPGSTTTVGPGVPEPGSSSAANPDSSGPAGGRASGRTSPSASSARAGTPGPTPTAGSAGSAGAPGSSPSGSAAAEMASDGPDVSAQPGPEDYSLPPVAQSHPAAGRNALVAAPRSVVASSTRSTLEDAVQVAIVASKRASTDALLRYYRGRLTRFGFTEFPVPAVGGSTAAAFRNGRDRVVVTVTPGGRGSVDYSVFGILHSVGS